MNFNVCILILLLMLGLANIGQAQSNFGLEVGKMSVGFNHGSDGLSISYDGVQLIRDSSIWVHNPLWTYHYYGLPFIKDPVQIKDIPDGKEVLITHKSESFLGFQRITITEHSVCIEFKYKLTQDAKDADLEYCFGNIVATPILGCPYKATTIKGDTKEGILDVHATSAELAKTLITADAIKKIEIQSRIGKLTLESSCDPDGLNIFDNRMSPYETADATPVFWSGILGTHLDYGKEYTHTDTLSIDPLSVKPATTQAGDVKSTSIVDKPDARTPVSVPVYVIPEPQEMKLTNADFILSESTKIVVGNKVQREDLLGAKSFAEEVKILYGFEPVIIKEADVTNEKSLILVGESSSGKMLSLAAKAAKIRAPRKDEGYILCSTPEHVLVLGNDRKGTYYGMQTLKQLLKHDPSTVYLQGCLINDWPSLKFRGAHLFTGNQALPFHNKLMDRIFSRFKMNNLVLETDLIKWKTDPGLAIDFSMDQEDIKKELAYAKDHFITVSPLLQSLGHSDWLFNNNKNRDIAECPEKPYSYCPLNPRTYNYVLPFYDEVVKLFDNPKMVHIGHDEVVEPGGFPKHEACKKVGAEQIFVDDVLKIHDHLKKLGARVMMWGDMMLFRGDDPDAMNAKSPEAAKWIRDRLPKDVIITDWHYAPDEPKTFKSVSIFHKAGHDTIGASWYTPANIEHLSSQVKKVGGEGLLQTTWAGFNSNENNLKENFIQFSAMILAAEYSWNNGKTDIDHLPYKWDEEFRKQWNPIPVQRQARKGFVLDLSSACNVSLADNNSKTGWLRLGSGDDMSSVPTGDVRLDGDLIRMPADTSRPSAIRLCSLLDSDQSYPDRVEVAVNRKAGSLLFVHTSAWTEKGRVKIGAYNVRYTDGTAEEIPLVYGVNITSWIDQRSTNGATKIWDGRTKSGQKISLWRAQWDNPHPEKEIKSIEMVSTNTTAGPLLIAISGLD